MKQDEARKRAKRHLQNLYRHWRLNEERGRRLVEEGRRRMDIFLGKGRRLVRTFARDGERLVHDLKTRLRGRKSDTTSQ